MTTRKRLFILMAALLVKRSVAMWKNIPKMLQESNMFEGKPHRNSESTFKNTFFMSYRKPDAVKFGYDPDTGYVWLDTYHKPISMDVKRRWLNLSRGVGAETPLNNLEEAELEKYTPLGMHLVEIKDSSNRVTTIRHCRKQDCGHHDWLKTVCAKLTKGPFPLKLTFCKCTANSGKWHNHKRQRGEMPSNKCADSNKLRKVQVKKPDDALGILKRLKAMLNRKREHVSEDSEESAESDSDVESKNDVRGKERSGKKFTSPKLKKRLLHRDPRSSPVQTHCSSRNGLGLGYPMTEKRVQKPGNYIKKDRLQRKAKTNDAAK